MTKELISWATSAGTLFGMYVVGRKLWVGVARRHLEPGAMARLHHPVQGVGPAPPDVCCLLVVYSKNLIQWRRSAALSATVSNIQN